MKIQQGAFSIACAALAFTWPSFVGLAASAPSAMVGKRCDLSVFGEKNTSAFLTFDHDLREAIENHDDARLALLVQYPLRITDNDGQIFIHDATSLQGHLTQIFTPAIRQAILSSTHGTISCDYTGITYGDGDVWVNATDHGYFVMTINLPAKGPQPAPSRHSVQIACQTSNARIVIDNLPGGTPTYRSWTFSQSVFDHPQMEISSGVLSWEGTGPCAHRVWTFHDGNTEIGVEQPGCYGDNDQPPSNAQAQIVANQPGKPKKTAWCF
jgi:hypothetical protein